MVTIYLKKYNTTVSNEVTLITHISWIIFYLLIIGKWCFTRKHNILGIILYFYTLMNNITSDDILCLGQKYDGGCRLEI